MNINVTKISSAKKSRVSDAPKTAVRKRTGVAAAIYELSVRARHRGWIASDNPLREWRRKIGVYVQEFLDSTDGKSCVIDDFLGRCDLCGCLAQGVELIRAVVGDRFDRKLAAHAEGLAIFPHDFMVYMLALMSHNVRLDIFNPHILLTFIAMISFGLPEHEKLRTKIIDFFLTKSDHRFERFELELLMSCANTDSHREKISAELVAHELAGDMPDER